MRCPDVESVNRIVFTCRREKIDEDAEEKERKQKTEEAQNNV